MKKICKCFVTTNLEKKERGKKKRPLSEGPFLYFHPPLKKNDNINKNLHATQENTIIIL
jgi:hypothetical protein